MLQVYNQRSSYQQQQESYSPQPQAGPHHNNNLPPLVRVDKQVRSRGCACAVVL